MSSEIELQLNVLIDALRTKEQEEKKRYDAAIDIEDMAEAKVVMLDARTNIQQLRKWANNLAQLQKEVAGSFISTQFTSHNLNITETEKSKAEEAATEDTVAYNAGEYVRQKLHQLSRTGFVFSNEQLKNIQDYMWCRNTLRLSQPLARIYDGSIDIVEQTAISEIPRQYWMEDRFKFGNVTLLIYSGWAALYIPYFDAWYETLKSVASNEPDDSVDSTLEEQQTTILHQTYETDSGQVKVGYYIRTKLKELDGTGYQPTSEEIEQWQDKDWSKKILNLNYPFARIYSEKEKLGNQTATDNGRKRYWAEVFKLAGVKLLFCSQWYRQDRKYFDRWYNSLNANDKVTSDLPISKPQAEEPVEAKISGVLDNAVSSDLTASNAEIPKKFTLLGKTYSSSSWDDILIKVCEMMILKKPYKVLRIGVKKSVLIGMSPALWFDERGESDEAYRLSNGLSVVKNKTDGEIMSCCECILGLCGYDRNELKIS